MVLKLCGNCGVVGFYLADAILYNCTTSSVVVASSNPLTHECAKLVYCFISSLVNEGTCPKKSSGNGYYYDRHVSKIRRYFTD